MPFSVDLYWAVSLFEWVSEVLYANPLSVQYYSIVLIIYVMVAETDMSSKLAEMKISNEDVHRGNFQCHFEYRRSSMSPYQLENVPRTWHTA